MNEVESKKTCHSVATLAFTLFAASSFGIPMANAQEINARSSGPGEIQETAERAYIYAYPLVLLRATMEALPVNHLTHVSSFRMRTSG